MHEEHKISILGGLDRRERAALPLSQLHRAYDLLHVHRIAEYRGRLPCQITDRGKIFCCQDLRLCA